ncbi:hypothetical protein [Saccharopolyspora tripterygii]
MMYASKISKIAAAGAGSLLLLGAGSGVAVGETQEEAVERAKAVCGEGVLCVWDGPDFTGAVNEFGPCAEGPVDFSFEDKRAGSWLNTQYEPGEAVFFGPNPDNPEELIEKYRSPVNEAISEGEVFDLSAVDNC